VVMKRSLGRVGEHGGDKAVLRLIIMGLVPVLPVGYILIAAAGVIWGAGPSAFFVYTRLFGSPEWSRLASYYATVPGWWHALVAAVEIGVFAGTVYGPLYPSEAWFEAKEVQEQ
jgi:hypothetical protein